MCGIAGFANYQFDKTQDIVVMMDRMFHRGPDAGGYYNSPDDYVTLGHRRLSILDISSNGAQPMISHNGRYVISYNGEIYNHKEILEKLIASSQIQRSDFKGTSDTEIILEAISYYGFEEAIKMFKGMFAISLYDLEEKKLYLTRDRIGEKPLYYGRVGEAFVFASDLGSIKALPHFENRINEKILDTYFIYGYIPAPYTIYEGIYKLKPGTYLSIDAPFTLDVEPKIETYWDIKEIALRNHTSNIFTGTYEEAVDELDRLLRNSIRGQMVADVPLGAFLSAGIDSSTTVALMQQLSDRKVRSFTIGMDDPAFNEATFAKEIANHLGTDHTELYITEKDAKAVIPLIANMFAEPFADSSEIPTYLVSKMTQEHVTVSLSGDGGDELFCGYTSYDSVSNAWKKINKLPAHLRRAAGSAVLHSPLKNDHDMRVRASLLKAKSARELYVNSLDYDPMIRRISLCNDALPNSNDLYEDGYLGEPNRDMMLMDMLMYHPDDILAKVDRTAMAVSLETRVPMLDKDVVEFSLSLPLEYLKDPANGKGKRILRDVLYRYVPREMMERPKKGFSIPIEKWLKEDPELKEWAMDLTAASKINNEGYLNADVVSHYMKDYYENGVWTAQIWNILMFENWIRQSL